jgi:UDP-N-acetylglucosamine:LPS N-acetylglucosamine transferase
MADPNRLSRQLSELLEQPDHLKELGQNLAKFAKPDATKELAKLILDEYRS